MNEPPSSARMPSEVMPPWGWSTKRRRGVAEPHVAVDRHRLRAPLDKVAFLQMHRRSACQAVRSVSGAGMERHRAAKMLRDLPQIVDAVAMVGMIVGDDDPVDAGDVRRQQLLAQIGAAIDQQALAAAFDQDRRSGCGGCCGSAGSQSPQSLPIRGTPVDVPQPRIADLHAAAFPNSLKKLAVVASASSSSGSPRRSARKAAVSATNAGSQVCAAVRHRREERRVGFDQQPVLRDRPGGFLQVAGVLEGHDARRSRCRSRGRARCGPARRCR